MDYLLTPYTPVSNAPFDKAVLSSLKARQKLHTEEIYSVSVTEMIMNHMLINSDILVNRAVGIVLKFFKKLGNA